MASSRSKGLMAMCKKNPNNPLCKKMMSTQSSARKSSGKKR